MATKGGAGREQFLVFYNNLNKDRLNEYATDYEKQPANIRAAIAKVAGVENKRLTELTSAEVESLCKASRKLIDSLIKANSILLLATSAARKG